MVKSTKRWNILPCVPSEHLARFPDFPPLVVQLLYNRQIRTPEEVSAFLSRSFAGGNPFLLKGMNEAVTRLRQAIRYAEPIAVYGDYDVDGVTATALLVPTLRALGAHVEPYIPRRDTEGYGLNKTALGEMARQGVKLIVTVDCGVRSNEEASFAKTLGLDMIITDHHTTLGALPEAVAVIDPRRADERYPFIHLSGVGLAYKLAQGLLRTQQRVPLAKATNPPAEEDLLDLVALGTIADLAPLVGENRALVSRGLHKLNEARRVGIKAMLQEAMLQPGQVDARTVGYILGPRLNAAGRLDSAMESYNLLVTTSTQEAEQLAQQLGATNQERQRQMKEMVEHARKEAAEWGEAKIYVLASPQYTAGIVGLVASRILDERYRPICVIAVDESGKSRGSARSIEGFHITEALDQCEKLLVQHGGHKAAAGFAIKNEKIDEFRRAMQTIADEKISSEQLQRLITIDAVLPLEAANAETLQVIENLQPFGIDNQLPTFASYHAKVCECRPVGAENRTFKFRLSDGKALCEAVAFRQETRAEDVPEHIDVVYTLQRNDWNGRVSIELMVKDWRPSEG